MTEKQLMGKSSQIHISLCNLSRTTWLRSVSWGPFSANDIWSTWNDINIYHQLEEPIKELGQNYKLHKWPGHKANLGPSDTHRDSVDVLHQLSDQPLRRRQHGSLVVKLAGLQHRQQVCTPQHRVLTHAEQQTLQLRAQLDRLWSNR